MSFFSFLIGAGIGAASTYLYKDQEARERVVETSKTLKRKACELIATVREKITPKKNDDIAQPEKVVAQKTDDAAQPEKVTAKKTNDAA